MTQKILCTITVLFLLVLCACPKRSQEEAAQAAPVVRVTSSPVVRGNIELAEVLPGKTIAEKSERIISPVAGRIIEQNGYPGMLVHAGDVLATVRARESDAALSGAQALLRTARSEDQKNEAARVIKLAEETQNTVLVKASLSGVIVSRSANLSELIAENAEIFSVIDLSSLEFVADAPLAALSRLRPGQHGSLTFDVISGKSYGVVLAEFGATADSLSHSVKVRLKFMQPPAPDPALRVDLPGSVRIVTGSHEGVPLVRNAAVLRNDENNSCSVVMITPDSLSKTVEVSLGASNDSMTEINSTNLPVGTPVIVQGNYGLADSTHVMAATGEHE